MNKLFILHIFITWVFFDGLLLNFLNQRIFLLSRFIFSKEISFLNKFFLDPLFVLFIDRKFFVCIRTCEISKRRNWKFNPKIKCEENTCHDVNWRGKNFSCRDKNDSWHGDVLNLFFIVVIVILVEFVRKAVEWIKLEGRKVLRCESLIKSLKW